MEKAAKTPRFRDVDDPVAVWVLSPGQSINRRSLESRIGCGREAR